MRHSLKNSLLGISLATIALALIFYATWQKSFVALFVSIFFLGLITMLLLSHALHHLYVLKLVKGFKFYASSPLEVPAQLSITIHTEKAHLLTMFMYQLKVHAEFATRPKICQTFALEEIMEDNLIHLEIPYRGAYKISLSLYYSDIFGLFSQRVAIPSHMMVQVAPRFSYLARNIDLAHAPDATSINMGNVPHAGEEPFDIRKYQLGDDPRRINWRQSVRFDELFIRHQGNTDTQLQDVRFVVFPPPFYAQAPQLLDDMIAFILEAATALNPEEVRLSLQIGPLFIDRFYPNPLEMRSQLCSIYAGMVYTIPESIFHVHKEKLIFVGCIKDPIFLNALHKYYKSAPMLFLCATQAHDDQQKLENLTFLAKSLNLEVHHV